MRYDQFYQCPICGCSLDPGEKCDCQKEKKEADANDAKRFIYGDPGQHKANAQRFAGRGGTHCLPGSESLQRLREMAQRTRQTKGAYT